MTLPVGRRIEYPDWVFRTTTCEEMLDWRRRHWTRRAAVILAGFVIGGAVACGLLWLVRAASASTFTVTAYTIGPESCGKHPGDPAYGITASGKRATGFMCAADRSIPFGTKLLINGQVWTVEDRGGAIKGNRIDLLFPTVKAAKAWGRRRVEVRVVRKGKIGRHHATRIMKARM